MCIMTWIALGTGETRTSKSGFTSSTVDATSPMAREGNEVSDLPDVRVGCPKRFTFTVCGVDNGIFVLDRFDKSANNPLRTFRRCVDSHKLERTQGLMVRL